MIGSGIGSILLHEGETAATVDLAQAADNYKTVWGEIVGIIAGNTVLSIFLFGGLIAMCWRHFRKAKGAVRG